MSPAVQRLRLALAAALVVCVGGPACQGADQYFRNRADGGALGVAGSGALGTAGSIFAGIMGVGGATAGAGTAGVDGSGGASAGAGGGGGDGKLQMAGVAGAAGAAGTAGAAGGAGAAEMPCTTCMVKLQYTCRSNDSGQASFVLDVTNESSISFPLSSLTLRYWYVLDGMKPQELDCDFAKLGCTNLVTSADTKPLPNFVPVTPPRQGANEYAEIAFKAGAFSLDPFLDTGEIQLRLHNQDFSPINQTDDYSFNPDNCMAMSPTAVEWTHITAYIDGVLVWGTEPGPKP